MENTEKTQEQQLPNSEASQPKMYTEEQVREIYNEGQKSGYIAAIKQIRSNINDYLDNLIVATSLQNTKGE